MIGGALSAVLGMVLFAGASAPAQAAPDAASARAETQNLDIESPGISPEPERIWRIGLVPSYDCPLGRACFAVWDHWLGEWKGINLYHCHTYALSHWLGNGDFSNNQTGGAAVTLYGQHGQVLGSYPPNGSRSYYSVNWDAVWKIKPC
jgi:hypothetical protein